MNTKIQNPFHNDILWKVYLMNYKKLDILYNML